VCAINNLSNNRYSSGLMSFIIIDISERSSNGEKFVSNWSMTISGHDFDLLKPVMLSINRSKYPGFPVDSSIVKIFDRIEIIERTAAWRSRVLLFSFCDSLE